MTKLTHNLGMKAVACFLVILSGLTSIISIITITFAGDCGFYADQPVPYAKTGQCAGTTYLYADRTMSWINSDVSISTLQERFAPDKTNFRFELFSKDGSQLLFTNIPQDSGPLVHIMDYRFSLYYDFLGSKTVNLAEGTANLLEDSVYEITFDSNHAVIYSDTGEEGTPLLDEPVLVTMRAYVTDPLTVSDEYWLSYRFYGAAEMMHNWAILFLLTSLIILAGSMVYLFCAAGHREGTNEIFPNMQDRIPLDLYFCIMGTLFSFCIFIGANMSLSNVANIMFGIFFLIAIGILLLATLLTCATRLKMGKWWRNTIAYWVFHFCWKFFLALCSTFLDVVAALPMVWKVAAAWLAVSLFYLTGPGVALILNTVLLFTFCSIASQLQKLKKAGQNLARGNLDYKVDTAHMLRSFRQHGENLNSISKGFSIALKQKMKSERMKTELITNVSHDIKTPLTSIVNYVDLLKKEGLEGQAAEYLEVLERQSRRLKKLTEDLVEASKASTGSLTVHLAPTDIAELVNQSVAEYEEKLEAAALEVIVNQPETPIIGMVDGGLTWRVLSNLLSNACKYSQTGTRVYIDIKKSSENVMISMKNISRDKLNVPADELMERFVRGDSSRHTEGSGLGLNIARSLVELQKGKFSLEIEGDMFKAQVRFPAAEETPQTEGAKAPEEPEGLESMPNLKPMTELGQESKQDSSETNTADE